MKTDDQTLLDLHWTKSLAKSSGHFALQAVLHPDAGNLEMNEEVSERMKQSPLARSDSN